MKSRGLVLDPEVSVDIEPGVVTLYDRSRFANNGVMTGVTWEQRPSGLWVIDFSGANQYIQFPDTLSLEMGFQDWTIELWFNTDAATSGMLISSSDNANAIGYRAYLRVSGIRGVLTNGAAALAISGAIVPTVGTWYLYHLTFDRDGNAQNYLNGVTDGAPTNIAAWAGTFISNAFPLRLGISGSDLSQDYNGRMTLARIYSYALAPGQILQRFEATRRFFGA